MNRDDIIRLAGEAGLWYSDSTFVWTSPTEDNQYPEGIHQETLERFAALVIQHKALDQVTALGQYEKGFEDGAAAEREACAKMVESKWADFEELKAAHYRQTSEPFDPFRYHKDLSTIFMSRDLAAAIRERGAP